MKIITYTFLNPVLLALIFNVNIFNCFLNSNEIKDSIHFLSTLIYNYLVDSIISIFIFFNIYHWY